MAKAKHKTPVITPHGSITAATPAVPEDAAAFRGLCTPRVSEAKAGLLVLTFLSNDC